MFYILKYLNALLETFYIIHCLIMNIDDIVIEKMGRREYEKVFEEK